MKTIMYCAVALAALGLAAAPLSAQTQTTTSTSTNTIETSKLIGAKVKVSQGEEVGEIKDVVLDNNGCMAYTVVSTTGGGGRYAAGKTVVVPWSVYSMTSDPRVFTVRVDRERIYNAPVFEYSRINEYSNPTFINQVYSYYGVSGGTGVSTTGAVSGSTTTTGRTEANQRMGYGAAPTPGTSPAGSPLASPEATAAQARSAESPARSPAANAESSASPTRNASRGESPSTKTRAKATPSSRRSSESATEERTGESREETTGSPSSSTRKSHHRHATEEGTTTESPKATPEQE
jgi:sporulation protein YlmC with PRC-barrel domain